jgi:hypothetical protein
VKAAGAAENGRNAAEVSPYLMETKELKLKLVGK